MQQKFNILDKDNCHDTIAQITEYSSSHLCGMLECVNRYLHSSPKLASMCRLISSEPSGYIKIIEVCTVLPPAIRNTEPDSCPTQRPHRAPVQKMVTLCCKHGLNIPFRCRSGRACPWTQCYQDVQYCHCVWPVLCLCVWMLAPSHQ